MKQVFDGFVTWSLVKCDSFGLFRLNSLFIDGLFMSLVIDHNFPWDW